MTRYDFLDARFVIWLVIDLLLLLVNIWFWAKNDQIWLPEARWMIFSNIRTDFNLIFGQFSVAKKLILNGGAIRPTDLLFTFWPINEKLVFKLFPLVVHMSPLWWGLHLLTFWCPWNLCKGPTWPRKKWNLFYFFIFFILTQKVLIRLLLYLTCKFILNRG